MDTSAAGRWLKLLDNRKENPHLQQGDSDLKEMLFEHCEKTATWLNPMIQPWGVYKTFKVAKTNYNLFHQAHFESRFQCELLLRGGGAFAACSLRSCALSIDFAPVKFAGAGAHVFTGTLIADVGWKSFEYARTGQKHFLAPHVQFRGRFIPCRNLECAILPSVGRLSGMARMIRLLQNNHSTALIR